MRAPPSVGVGSTVLLVGFYALSAHLLAFGIKDEKYLTKLSYVSSDSYAPRAAATVSSCNRDTSMADKSVRRVT